MNGKIRSLAAVAVGIEVEGYDGSARLIRSKGPANKPKEPIRDGIKLSNSLERLLAAVQHKEKRRTSRERTGAEKARAGY